MRIQPIAFTTVLLANLVSCAPAPCADSDPASVVKAYYEAENADDLDAAMAYIANDAVFTFPREGQHKGQAEIREWEK